jgi:hypothetical protein
VFEPNGFRLFLQDKDNSLYAHKKGRKIISGLFAPFVGVKYMFFRILSLMPGGEKVERS